MALLLDKTDFVAPGNGIGYPTVVKVAGRLASPVDDWYMWCSAHDESAGIFMATAPSPAGPWTPYNSGNPVITSFPSGTQDIAAPFVLWHAATSKLWMWAHSLVTVGSTQRTYFWESTDGITWTLQNSGNPVLLPGTSQNENADSNTAAYLTVVPTPDGRLHGLYQGVSVNSDTLPNNAKEAHVLEATSPDGITWTKLGYQGRGNGDRRAAWENETSRDSGRPVGFLAGGRLYCYYAENGGSTMLNWCRQRLNGGWSARFDSGMPLGANGDWDDYKAVVSDIVYDNDTFYAFYTGDGTSLNTDDEAIGVATCSFPNSDFETTWGKG